MIRPLMLTLAAGLTVLAASAIGAGDPAPTSSCSAPAALVAIGPELTHAAARVDHNNKLTIVAIGSSSTRGVGASAPELSYPSRLEVELRERFPQIDIAVINRGKNGEDVREELARLDSEVIAEHPDLVIWQLGTNAVLRRDDVAADGELIRRGVALLQAGGSDVVLMDLQYAPRVLARSHHAVMERLISEAAESTHVGLFRRFEIMRHWHESQTGDAAPMVGPDGLHMTDRGYGCLATELAQALAANWQQQRAQTAAASGPPSPLRRAAAIAP